ncbi:MAG TPA: hypothetical protein VJ001_07350, partial [Rhodocyclaceae bacterium]|nr:hypothetical protein [Rhodocyclaceae bacterium]
MFCVSAYAASQLPAPTIALSSTTNSITANWSWSGNSAGVSAIALNIRDLNTGAIVSGYPVTVTKSTSSYTFNGLTPAHNHRISVEYTAANSNYLSGGATKEISTQPPVVQLPAPTIALSSTTNSVIANWSWSGDSAGVSAIELNIRDLNTGAIVSGYPVTVTKSTSSYTFNGLTPAH